MADLQTPTEATLLSTANSAAECTIPVSKEAGTQASLADKIANPNPTPTSLNGETSTTLTNGVAPTPTATATPVPASKNDLTKTNGVEEDPPLFSLSLISPEVLSILPQGYTMRPLRRSDYNGGGSI